MISFYLVNANRERSAINVRFSIRGILYKIPTGISCDTKFWIKKTMRIKNCTECKEAYLLNKSINSWNKSALQVLEYYSNTYKAPTQEEVKKKLHSFYYDKIDIEGTPTLVEYTKSLIEKYKNIKSVHSIQKYRMTLLKIEEYQGDKDVILTFEDINMSFFWIFKEWFFTRDYSQNYFANIINTLKNIFNEANKRDKLHNILLDEEFTGLRVETDSIYLNVSELDKLGKLNITSNLVRSKYDLDEGQLAARICTYHRVRDFFIFGCYTGLRVSDFTHLRNYNIQDGYIYKKTKKVKVDVIIPIHPKAQEILDNGLDIESMVYPSTINLLIKDLAQWAGIDKEILINEHRGGEWREIIKKKYELVQTHTARRSFATNAYLAKVPVLQIMKITGHTTIKSFMKYIRISLQENAELLKEHEFYRDADILQTKKE